MSVMSVEPAAAMESTARVRTFEQKSGSQEPVESRSPGKRPRERIGSHRAVGAGERELFAGLADPVVC